MRVFRAHGEAGIAEGTFGEMRPDELKAIACWTQDLAPDELERAAQGTKVRTYEPGGYICHRGDRLDSWTGVAGGLIKISAISETGKAMTFAGVGAGGWFGEGSLLKDEARKYDVVALRQTELAMMARATFMWLFEHSVGFNRFLVHQLNERMGQFIATIECDRMHDPTARVARHLAALCHPILSPNVGFRIEITQEELALLAGVSRPIVKKALQHLEAADLITLERGQIAVRDKARLSCFEM